VLTLKLCRAGKENVSQYGFPYTLCMCGRYRLARKKEILAEVFDAADDVDWSPRYNIAPNQSVPVVRQDATRPVRFNTLHRQKLCAYGGGLLQHLPKRFLRGILAVERNRP
jgi:hypothetical protein